MERPDDEIVRNTITLPRSLSEGMRELATRHDRPISWEFRRAIESHLANEADPKDAA